MASLWNRQTGMLVVIYLVATPSSAQSGEGKAGSGKVLELQASGEPSDSSHARLATPLPSMASFTLCYMIKLNRFREESTFLSYAISDDRDNEFRIDHRETGYKVSLQGHWAISQLASPLRTWAHFCFSYNKATSQWTMYLNGEQRAQGSFPKATTSLPPGGAFIIGQEQDSFGGGFQRDQSFSGEVTGLNIWSSVLTPPRLSQVWSCNGSEEGDLLAWSSSTWILEGEAMWLLLPLSDLCRSPSRTINIFPDRFSLAQARHLCRVMGGSIMVPLSNEENSWLYETTKNDSLTCSGGMGSSYLWLGATDADQEGKWVKLETGRPLSWLGPWRGDKPNGGTQENCMVMLTGNFPGLWSDIACLETYSFCVPCESAQSTTIYLKGPAVCKYSPFNHQYQLGEMKGGRPSLKGFFHSDIYWDNGVWLLQSLKVNATAWHRPVKEGIYPFGTYPWTLGGDICEMSSGTVVNLTLSVCGRGQFTCADGNCVDLSQRCDLRVDCSDQSDEVECSLVDIPSGYSTVIPPPPTNVSHPVPIHFVIRIIAFPSIATQDQTITTILQLSLRWKDVRLNYLNLKTVRSLNLLEPRDVKSIWTPRVFFVNAKGNVFTNLAQGSRVECVLGGPSMPGPPHLPKEVNLFPGSDTSLEMSQMYSASYTCDFYLAMFPFDSQVCQLNFTLVSAAASYMVLDPRRAYYTGPKFLIEYEIGEVRMEVEDDEEFSTLVVYVRFSRRYTFYLVTLYIPTVLLILIAYATFFFNPDDFNSRVVVAVTSLLVLTSLLTQTSNALPKTSYFKLIDVWLFFSIVIIFLVILLQTLVNFSKPSSSDHTFVPSFLTSLMAKLWLRCGNNDKSAITKVRSANLKQDEDKIRAPSHQLSPRLPPNKREEQELRQKRKRMWGVREWDNNWDGIGIRGGQEVNMALMVKSRIIIPIIYLIFNIVYWTIALQ